ncbi:hypothetical protein T484DRAFT_1924605 [Baffinella frigidus]|nr:hypothetical protein T484DRAFT_1924605 [Cryptophyta sp. CCMP2293]
MAEATRLRGGAAVGGVLLALAVVCWVGFGGSDTARTTLFEWDTRNDASRGERRVVRGVDADDPRFKVDALDAEDATPMMGTQEQGWYGNSLGVGKGTKLQGGFAMQPSGGEGEMASDNGPIENFRVSILLRKNIQMAKSEEQLSGIQVQRDAVHQSLMHLEEKAASLLAKQRDIKGDLEVYTQRQEELVNEIKKDAEFYTVPSAGAEGGGEGDAAEGEEGGEEAAEEGTAEEGGAEEGAAGEGEGEEEAAVEPAGETVGEPVGEPVAEEAKSEDGPP